VAQVPVVRAPGPRQQVARPSDRGRGYDFVRGRGSAPYRGGTSRGTGGYKRTHERALSHERMQQGGPADSKQGRAQHQSAPSQVPSVPVIVPAPVTPSESGQRRTVPVGLGMPAPRSTPGGQPRSGTRSSGRGRGTDGASL
jgi:hypothetical protein